MNITFPNGQTLTSTALTPDTAFAILQPIICAALGITSGLPVQATLVQNSNVAQMASLNGISVGCLVTGNGIPNNTTVAVIGQGSITLSNNATISGVSTLTFTDPKANTAVRKAWQQQGAPAFGINDDVASLEVTLVDAENDYDKIRDSWLTSNDNVSVTTNLNYTRKWKLVVIFRGPNAFDHARLLKSAMLLDFLHDMLAAENLYLLPGMPTQVRLPELFEGQWWERNDLSLYFFEQVTETLTVPSVASTEVIINDVNGVERDFTVIA